MNRPQRSSGDFYLVLACAVAPCVGACVVAGAGALSGRRASRPDQADIPVTEPAEPPPPTPPAPPVLVTLEGTVPVTLEATVHVINPVSETPAAPVSETPAAPANSPSVWHFVWALLVGVTAGFLPIWLGSRTDHTGLAIWVTIGVWALAVVTILVALARHSDDKAGWLRLSLIRLDDSPVLALWIHGFTFGYGTASAAAGILALLKLT